MRFHWTLIAAVFGALAVGLGAFGSHGLKQYLSPDSLKIFDTANKYHFYHTFLLLFIAHLLSNEKLELARVKLLGLAAWFVAIGILVFSGSLYALAITQIRILGAITPIGGVCFILSWILLAYSYRKI